jgi:tellurite resistance protein TerC
MSSDQRGNVVRFAIVVGLGLAVGAWFAIAQGTSAAAEYYAAYFLEEMLSVDNIFVFVIIFSELHIPDQFQRRVLRFGVAGAVVFRALMIGGGITLIQYVSWITYPFALLIFFAAWRMLFGAEREQRVVEEACNVCETWIARVISVSPVMRENHFWRHEGGRRVATPLLVALVVIETTDIVFALDSIPAVLSVTRNPLIVYSSNVMAMLGLRSLYFLLAHAINRLRYLRPGLALVLGFTGTKMLAASWIHISAGMSVLVIGIVMVVTIAVSVLRGNQVAQREEA